MTYSILDAPTFSVMSTGDVRLVGCVAAGACARDQQRHCRAQHVLTPRWACARRILLAHRPRRTRTIAAHHLSASRGPARTTTAGPSFEGPAVVFVIRYRGSRLLVQARRPADGDVAELGAGVDLDPVDPLAGLGGVGGGELVVDTADTGVQLQPGGAALADADLDAAVLGCGGHRAAGDLADPHPAVGAFRGDVGQRAVDGHRTVGDLDGRGTGDHADPHLPVAAGDLGGAVHVDDPDVTGAGVHLGGAADALDGDRPGTVADVQRAGLGEADGAEVGLELDGAEHAVGLEVAETGLAAHVGVGGQLDDHIDRLGTLAAEVHEPVAGLARDDAERAGRVVVLDAGVLGSLDVGGLVRVAGADLDDRVGAVGDGEVDVGDVEVEGDGDRGRGVEVRDGHLRFLYYGVVF